MMRRWWKRFLYGVGAGHHLERCPFCGQTFDIRDLGQVLLHRDHLLAADDPPAIDLIYQSKTTRHRRAMWCRSDAAAKVRTSGRVRTPANTRC